MAPSKPANSGDSYCTAFARRRWKLEAELVPKPVLRSTLLVEVKLPLETPRNEISSPNVLKGVSMRPSLTVPQALLDKPTNESRWAKAESLESTWNSVSSCQTAFRSRPSFSEPRKPSRELLDAISVREMMLFSPVEVPA